MKIVSISISKKKGTPKAQVEKASLLEDHGIEGDAHAGPWHRQVSFLAAESIEMARQKGLTLIISTSDSRWITKGTESFVNLWIIKDLDYELIKGVLLPIFRMRLTAIDDQCT